MFRHSPEAPIVDLPIVAVIDLEVVVVIRFVAMESIPERSVAQEVWWEKGEIKDCLSSIILSPLNGNVKLSPYETGDIHVESEGTTASERDQRVHQGSHGVCQSRRTPVSERAPS